MDQDERRNAILAVLLTTLIVLGWSFLVDRLSITQRETEINSGVSVSKKAQENLYESSGFDDVYLTRESGNGDLLFENRRLIGSVRIRGAVFDDLALKGYYTSTDSTSHLVSLFSSRAVSSLYCLRFGWKSSDKSLELPNKGTEWTIRYGDENINLQQTALLLWKNSQGLIFEQSLSLDDDYMFTVTQRVRNESDKTVVIQPYGDLSRTIPVTSDYMILHEGPLGFMNHRLYERTYRDLSKGQTEVYTLGGWFGITDKYWLASIIPGQSSSTTVQFFKEKTSYLEHDRVHVNFSNLAETLYPGTISEITYHYFAGAKVLEILDEYERNFSIQHFDKAVDFGWFYFITKPMFYTLSWFKTILGNFGLAILMLTVILKLIFFPLSTKSYHSMSRMRFLQPEIKHIQDLYRDDRLRVNQEVIRLYKREKVNPMTGCLPTLVQIPVFFALYKVLFISIEMRQAPFFWWIQDLSQPDPTSLFNLFGIIPWCPPGFLIIGVWPIMMGVSMVLQNMVNPPSVDPRQTKILKIMPIIFTFLLAHFPSGLVIYWTWSNILSIIQQWILLRAGASRTGRRSLT